MANKKDPIQAMMDEAVASVERIERQRKGDDEPGIEIETETPGRDASPAADHGASAVGAGSASPQAVAGAAGAPSAEVAEMRDQLLRMAADFDNYRKRVRRDQDELRRFASEGLLRDLLPVADNLERALSHADNNDDPVIQGVRMVLKQFADVMQNAGVREFQSAGKPFDPERHEAVGQEYDAQAAPGSVLREMMRGYTLHDRLLRPARVVVASSNKTTN